MARVIVQKDEPIDKAIYRFKKAYNKDGTRGEVMKRSYYMKPSEAKRAKHNKVLRIIKKGRKQG